MKHNKKTETHQKVQKIKVEKNFMRNIIFFLCVCTFIPLKAQTHKTEKAVEINRVEVKKTSAYSVVSDGDWDEIEAHRWGLMPFHKTDFFYSFGQRHSININWFDWKGKSIQNTRLYNGCSSSKISNQGLSFEIITHPEELEITFINNSLYYFLVKTESLFTNIVYFDTDNDIKQYDDFSQAHKVLHCVDRGGYDYVLLPPNAKATCVYFVITGKNDGYDIISDVIKNGSLFTTSFRYSLYASDPFTTIQNQIRNRNIDGWITNTPIQVQRKYNGGYYIVDNAIYIDDRNVSLLGTPDLYLENSVFCTVKVSSSKSPAKKDKYGLLQFGL